MLGLARLPPLTLFGRVTASLFPFSSYRRFAFSSGSNNCPFRNQFSFDGTLKATTFRPLSFPLHSSLLPPLLESNGFIQRLSISSIEQNTEEIPSEMFRQEAKDASKADLRDYQRECIDECLSAFFERGEFSPSSSWV